MNWTGKLLVLLLGVHVIFQLVITSKFSKHKTYQKQWDKIASQKSNVDKIVTELKQLREKVKSVEKVLGGEKISWPQKLSAISDSLPRGVWLNKITLSDKSLLIQGSAVSKNKTEMINVHNFTASLKNSGSFKRDFGNVELELIKSRKVNITQIADFTIKGDLKQ